MRSLWRLMALRWLGGEGSEALSGDSAVLDLLPPEESDPVFRVIRDPRAGVAASPPSPAPGGGQWQDLEHPASRRR